MEQPLVLEEDRKDLILRLNRPEMMNSLNFGMLRALAEKVEALQWDQDVRVIIISGAGEKAFCAGADFKRGLLFPKTRLENSSSLCASFSHSSST